MNNPFGFMEYQRKEPLCSSISERIKNYNEFHTPLSQKEQKIQGERCMNCGVPFCQSGMMIGGMISGCPLNNLVPEWNYLVSIGAWKQAYERLKLTNNFPEFTSRVCPALCEKACTCGANGEPVTVRANEYSIIEQAYSEGYARPQPPKVRTGKKIAVIGSGPSGLAAADQLNKRGHSVTVYERSDRVGGLLMYGIPNMKLEKHIVNRKIDIMKAEGINFITNADVGKDISAEDILKQYDRVILACGASNPRDIAVKGREANGIYFAVDFLKSTTKALLDNSEDYINSKEEDLRSLEKDSLLQYNVPLDDIWDEALKIIPDDEISFEIISNAVNRLKIRIIDWDKDKCKKCQLCIPDCPTKCISFDEKEDTIVRDKDRCLRCSICYQTCPFSVIKYFIAKFSLEDDRIIHATVKASNLNEEILME